MADLTELERDITVRNIKQQDLDDIAKLSQDSFGSDISLKREHFASQLRIFPKGQLCVEYKGRIVGSSSSLIVNYGKYDRHPTYDEICDDGYIRNHEPDGLHLYGIEVGVHPDFRQMKIGRRLYEARRKLCQELNLKGILIGGRIPNYHQYADRMTAQEYAEQVVQQNIYDPVLTFQLKNGFVLRDIMANYLPDDEESLQYATLLEWPNDSYIP